MSTNKAREEIIDMFKNALKENKIPWRQGWMIELPENADTKKAYKGLNRMILMLVSQSRNYKDNRFCTFKQAEKNGWKVKKGEKGIPIEFYSIYDVKEKKLLNSDELCKFKEKVSKGEMTREEYEERIKPIIRVSHVFNAEQIEGIPVKEIIKHKTFEEKNVIEIRDAIISEMKPLEFRTGGNSAFYNPINDYIQLPDIYSFRSPEEYLSTFLHETSHATGHESRLNRNIKNTFGSEDYAREELRAEISSTFIYQDIGIEPNDDIDDNHKAYIQSWIEVLEKEPNELIKAIRESQDIADYVVEKYNKGIELIKNKELEFKEIDIEKKIEEYKELAQKTENDLKLAYKKMDELIPRENIRVISKTR
ncbi:Antirestriction protein ArdC [Eubacterium uniforme]|uniref:Antirestriction protein ArdC n=1 Tax=Eubacterium uniforme TaxID=39495 RepID=A0A1T4W6X5_9FIRM|nr:zincin-like metallopeptidase domain-containing protein [Eubacterium uniforme]SKA73032.1 Antirestriction protein ArdC [Eubacterium uniforme]